MSTPRRTRAALAAATVPAAGIALFAGATPAVAAATCPTGWSEVAPGVCSRTVTASGTVTVPAGVTHLEALLVGGGAGSSDAEYESYGKGLGGEVVYLDEVSTGGPVVVTIGAGGVYEPHPEDVRWWNEGSADGEPTTLLDHAGVLTTAAGGIEDPEYHQVHQIAPPVLPSAFVAAASGATALWPAFAGETAVSGDGEPGQDDLESQECPDPHPAAASGAPNTGHGADGAHWIEACWSFSTSGLSTPGTGGSGVVILRFAPFEATGSETPAGTGSTTSALPTVELAATGAAPAAPLAVAAAALVVGAGLLALRPRRR